LRIRRPRIGFELFDFDGNHAPDENLPFRQHGTFHFAIQDPDLEGLLEKIVAPGGKQLMPVREHSPREKAYRRVCVVDLYMRGRMSDAPSYAAPVEIGDVMVGATVGQIGKIRYREEMIEGFEQAPTAFAELLRGEAFGKRVVHLKG
jgi:hypothetical protein